MLTLARRSEIFEAEVSEFDQVAEPQKDGTTPDAKKRRAVWKIPAHRRKNGEALTIPLSGDAWEIVEALSEQAIARGSQYLFPGDSGAYKPTSKAWAQLLKVAGLVRVNEMGTAPERPEEGKAKKRAKWTAHPLRFHDLRRAGRAIMERELEIPASVAEAVIGHLAPSLIRTYSPEGPGIPQRARALDAWSEYLADAINGEREKGRVIAGTFGREARGN
jgi:integrase